MKRVGVHEFGSDAARYLAGDEPLAIEQHGELLGYYVPVDERHSKLKLRDALQRLERTVQRVTAETGLSEDELADLFDLSKPLPDDLGSRRPKSA